MKRALEGSNTGGRRETWTSLIVERGGRLWTLYSRTGDDSLYIRDSDVGDLLGFEDPDDLSGLIHFCREHWGPMIFMEEREVLSEPQALLLTGRSGSKDTGTVMRQLVEVYRIAHAAQVRAATLAEEAERRRAMEGGRA